MNISDKQKELVVLILQEINKNKEDPWYSFLWKSSNDYREQIEKVANKSDMSVKKIFEIICDIEKETIGRPKPRYASLKSLQKTAARCIKDKKGNKVTR